MKEGAILRTEEELYRDTMVLHSTPTRDGTAIGKSKTGVCTMRMVMMV